LAKPVDFDITEKWWLTAVAACRNRTVCVAFTNVTPVVDLTTVVVDVSVIVIVTIGQGL
jgi:hypothetical protein